MDAAEHERSYAAFVAFSKTSLAFIMNVLLCLLLLSVAKTGAFLTLVYLFCAIFAAGIGFLQGKEGWKLSAGVFLLGWVIFALYAG